MIKILRKVTIGVMSTFCSLSVLGIITMFSLEALAQTYPTKPIRIIVGNAPGSSSDLIARLIGRKLSEALGQQVIVDNRAGAGGRIGVEIAARAAPDGYTLLMMTSAHVSLDAVYKDLQYDLVKDFSPISLVGMTPAALVVNPSVPATSVMELVTLAKSRPGALKYGSGGSGSSTDLPAVIFKFMTDTDILHIPYKSNPAALTNTLTGEVDMTIQPITVSLPLIMSGKLRALGVTSLKRTPLLPDVPAISESVPGFEFMMWQGLVAPAKTPPAILSKLNTEIIKALNTSVVQEQMATLGNEPSGNSPKDFALFISEQLSKLRKAVKMSGARLE